MGHAGLGKREHRAVSLQDMLVVGRENTELCPSRTCWLWEERTPSCVPPGHAGCGKREPRAVHPATHLFPLSASALPGISGSVDFSHLRATVNRTLHSCCIYLAGFGFSGDQGKVSAWTYNYIHPWLQLPLSRFLLLFFVAYLSC